MSQYYFTVATLPSLFFDSDASVTTDDFLELCESTMEERDFRKIAAASLSPVDAAGTGIDALEQWTTWESTLRNSLVNTRAAAMGADPETYRRGAAGFEIDIVRAIAEADQAANPLEAEQALDRARWTRLDELEVGHYFDVTKLAIYYLKLQILERKADMNQQAGQKRFDAIYAAVSENGREVFDQN